MGANEKHAATYHGRKYTPSMAAVREDYATRMATYADSTRRIQFDRWIATVRAEAKAEAWDECMSSAYIDGVNRRVVNVPNPYKDQS